jgi:hypothetical protein
VLLSPALLHFGVTRLGGLLEAGNPLLSSVAHGDGIEAGLGGLAQLGGFIAGFGETKIVK